MPKVSTAVERIDGWKDIATYLGKDVSTAIRWEKLNRLPIHRMPGGQRHGVFAWRHEIDEWLQGGQNDSNEHNNSVTPEETPLLTVEESPRAQAGPSRMRPRTNTRWLLWAVSAATVFAVCVFAIYSRIGPRRIQITDIVQLTSDATLKQDLVTDGQQLYFGEAEDGRLVLSEMSVEGGPVRSIPTPFIAALPQSISPDGKKLLVLDHEGKEDEMALWIVPTEGGEPRQAGGIFCQAAAWSPDGSRIAYATGDSIYLTPDEGATKQRVQQVAGVPLLLRWSPDGKRLQFNLADENTERPSLWELTFDAGNPVQVVSLTPLYVSLKRNLSSLELSDNDDRSFIAMGQELDNRIWFLQQSWSSSGARITPVALNGQLAHIAGLALDRRAHRLFALSDSTGGTELLRFNPATRASEPFLPGVSAKYVDFSRDGRWITYVDSGSNSLWVSLADGSERRQIQLQEAAFELPRWSPDGQRIAFTAKYHDKPWRIFVVPAEGGIPKEASTGSDNQGAPTWSPDGRWLMYGNVKCGELGRCAIHKIDLSSGQATTLPSSEGMRTARWSPDGKHVAALHPERRQVYVFDVATEKWRKLADGVNGDDLNWSEDSRYVYASRPGGDKPDILRISLSSGNTESVVDLSSFNKLTGDVDTWFGLAPGGSIIFMRSLEQTEIYALRYQEK